MHIFNLKGNSWSKRWLDRRFLSNVGFVGISNILYAISQWGILIFLTKLGGIDDVASFSLGLAIVSPVMLFWGASLRVFIASDVQHQYTFEDYFYTRLITCSIGLLVISIIGVINGYGIVSFTVLILIGVIKAIEGIQEVCWGISQRSENMKSVGVSRILRSLTSVFSIGLILWFTDSLLLSLVVWLFTWLMILVLYDLPHTIRLEPFTINIKPQKTVNIIKATLPLAFIAGLIALNEKVSLYQIAAYLGETSVGYFVPLSFMVQGISLGITSINETATPRQAFNFKLNRKIFVHNTLTLAGFGAIVGIFTLIFFGSFRSLILPLIYSDEFLVYKDLFVILLGIGIIRFILAGFGTSITAAGWLREQVPIMVVSLLVTFLTGWFLIPRFGLYGAAYSVASGLVINLISIVFLWLKIIRFK